MTILKRYILFCLDDIDACLFGVICAGGGGEPICFHTFTPFQAHPAPKILSLDHFFTFSHFSQRFCFAIISTLGPVTSIYKE